MKRVSIYGGSHPGKAEAKAGAAMLMENRTRIETSNEELRSIRDAGRELGKLIDALEQGDVDKFVLTKHGKMRAVIISLETYEEA